VVASLVYATANGRNKKLAKRETFKFFKRTINAWFRNREISPVMGTVVHNKTEKGLRRARLENAMLFPNPNDVNCQQSATLKLNFPFFDSNSDLSKYMP